MVTNLDDALVIGSGPAGVAATLALLATHRTVKMVDIGARLESDRAQLIRQLTLGEVIRADRPEWSFARTGLSTNARIPLKTVFGSEFAYADEGIFAGGKLPKGFGLLPSRAYGGFSNVWGAALLRLIDSDLIGWPFAGDALLPHYDAIEANVPISAHVDGLSRLYPNSRALHSLEPSTQASKFLDRLARRLPSKERVGFAFGYARLAVGSSCRRCGMCLYGCPYGQIFNTASLVEDYMQRPGFTYVPGARVFSLSETSNRVEVIGRAIDGRPFIEHARRVFLAAGPLATPLILLTSMRERQRHLRLQDSQYFLLPLLGPPASGSDKRMPFTLAQAFIEINDPEVSSHAVHNQLYTYNDYFADNLRQRFFGGNFAPLDSIVKWLAQRMMVVQSYLHSSLSGHAQLRLGGSEEAPTLTVEPRMNAETRPAVRRVWRRLATIGRRGGLLAMPMLGQIGEIGRGYHSGGSFPMRRHPGFGESDVLGRPFSFSRVHVVDGSCLPTIPSTAPTLTIMANAHRIATTATRGV